MSVNTDLFYALVHKVETHIAELNEHTDVKYRMTAVRSNKKLIADYFKISMSLNNALHNARVPNAHLETTLRRFALNMNNDAKKIITFYQTYSKNFADKGRLQFQMDLAEVSSLLKRRVKNEREHLIPEYETIKKEYPDAFS